MTTQAERIAVLESRMTDLDKRTASMDKKLDDLLALRYKGAGAFWLASSLFGIIIAVVIGYFKG